MAGYKINRITSDIKISLSELLREVKDPRVSKLLSIVKVDVSGDLSYATVYVSAIEGYEATVSSVKALKNDFERDLMANIIYLVHSLGIKKR